MTGFEKCFIYKMKRGTSEPVYERFMLRALGIKCPYAPAGLHSNPDEYAPNTDLRGYRIPSWERFAALAKLRVLALHELHEMSPTVAIRDLCHSRQCGYRDNFKRHPCTDP